MSSLVGKKTTEGFGVVFDTLYGFGSEAVLEKRSLAFVLLLFGTTGSLISPLESDLKKVDMGEDGRTI